MNYEARILAAADFLHSRTNIFPTIGMVLGSGLGDFCDQLEGAITVPFAEIPDFPQATVPGHTGAFVFAHYRGKEIVALKGRLHYYEGYSMQTITLPIRVMKELGVQKLLLTNAAGGVNLRYQPGTLMLLSDHINFSGSNPLIGNHCDRFGPRFPDMSDLYRATTRRRILAAAKEAGIELEEGVYVMYSGPNYETPAEIRAFRVLGGDAVGMSTVPEALVANQCGMEVTAVSCITNMAAGILPVKLSHQEVTETANQVKHSFCKLVELIVDVM